MVLRSSQLPYSVVPGPNQGNKPVAKQQPGCLKGSCAPDMLTFRGPALRPITHIQMNHINQYNSYLILKS